VTNFNDKIEINLIRRAEDKLLVNSEHWIGYFSKFVVPKGIRNYKYYIT
jgi:hypothetical protein